MQDTSCIYKSVNSLKMGENVYFQAGEIHENVLRETRNFVKWEIDFTIVADIFLYFFCFLYKYLIRTTQKWQSQNKKRNKKHLLVQNQIIFLYSFLYNF